MPGNPTEDLALESAPRNLLERKTAEFSLSDKYAESPLVGELENHRK